MENEEKEDLLIEITESESDLSEKGENDCYLEGKIREFIAREKQPCKSKRKTIVFILACLLSILSSSMLIVTLPIYVEYSRRSGIQSYSKLVVLSAISAALFTAAHVLANVVTLCTRRKIAGFQFHLCLPKVLKICLLMSAASLFLFTIIDKNLVSCHLQDPLKGCAIFFSLVFYFFFSQKKMSLERIFCTVTVIIGVFITVDYGICDKFRCYGNDYNTDHVPVVAVASSLQFLYIVVYIASHGMWVLNFTYLENSCYLFNGSNAELNMSIVTKASDVSSAEKPSARSLSFICQEDTSRSHFYPEGTVSHVTNFPLTSTPNESSLSWQAWVHWRGYNIMLWQHWVCFIIVLCLCWLPTVSFSSGRQEKLLIDVVDEVWFALTCHSGRSATPVCDRLLDTTLVLATSYVLLVIAAMMVLSTARSAVTVLCLLMNGLPVAGLWWSLWRMDFHSIDVLVFQPEITGEAICAMLGFPIIGVGTLLLVKSHVREFHL